MALVRRHRLCSGLALLIFTMLMATGFVVADDRSAGGFWNGLSQLDDFPAMVLSEAWEKIDLLPEHMLIYSPALIETINIAAVSMLIGAMAGFALSLLARRGLAPWPRLILENL